MSPRLFRIPRGLLGSREERVKNWASPGTCLNTRMDMSVQTARAVHISEEKEARLLITCRKTRELCNSDPRALVGKQASLDQRANAST